MPCAEVADVRVIQTQSPRPTRPVLCSDTHGPDCALALPQASTLQTQAARNEPERSFRTFAKKR